MKKTSHQNSPGSSSHNSILAQNSQKVKVALVCDWLVNVGGAERVLLELHKMYPDAPIYTSKYDPRGIDWFKDADVRTGWLQIFPNCLRRFLSPLRFRYFKKLDLTAYDLVFSVTGAEAKAVKTKQTERKVKNRTGNRPDFSTPGGKSTAAAAEHSATPDGTSASAAASSVSRTTHLCFCHVPTQYYWGLYDDYLKNPGFGLLNPLVRLVLKASVGSMRKKDFAAAQQPDAFITISDYSRQEIAKYYKREAIVIAPPVDTKTFSAQIANNVENIKAGKSQVIEQHNYSKSQYFVATSRQVSWKRLDLAVQACQKTHQKLILIGDGPEHKRLKKLANNDENIVFLPQMSTKDLKPYLENAAAYLFPSKEPFGIAPVEALAAGCPVIAYRAGGALDYLKPGENGLFFNDQTVDSLAAALKKFNPADFDRRAVARTAFPFDTEVFKHEMEEFIHEKTA